MDEPTEHMLKTIASAGVAWRNLDRVARKMIAAGYTRAADPGSMPVPDLIRGPGQAVTDGVSENVRKYGPEHFGEAMERDIIADLRARLTATEAENERLREAVFDDIAYRWVRLDSIAAAEAALAEAKELLRQMINDTSYNDDIARAALARIEEAGNG